MKLKNKIASVLLLCMAFPFLSFGNGFGENMYKSGFIWVVIAVLLVILLGIFFYLIRMDKKLNKLEDKNS